MADVLRDQPIDINIDRHPPGLYVLFATEMWERFSFYTMLAMFTLYLRNADEGFGWSPAEATALYANYLMFVYASPLVGGYLASWKLGFRRAVMIGAVFFIAGNLLMTIHSLTMVYAALVCLVIGNGFFKPNISAMVGTLYPPGSHLKDRAFNIFYMGINIGAFLAPVTAEFVKGHFGFHPAFAVAAGGMVISIGILWWFRSYVEEARWQAPRPAPVDVPPETALAEDVPPATEPAHAIRSTPPPTRPAGAAPPQPIDAIPDWKRIGVLLVIFAIVIVFWMVFHQNGSTLLYWADENTDWNVSGTISHAINPFWVVTLTFPLIWFWKWLDKKGLEPSTPNKMAIGMVLTGCAFLVLALAAQIGESDALPNYESGYEIVESTDGSWSVVWRDHRYAYKLSPWWLIGTYFVLTLAELMLSPMGLALVAKVSPPRYLGVMMGGWFVATAIGNKLTVIGVLWTEWLHSSFWLLLSGLAFAIAVVLALLLRPLKKAMPGV